METQSSDTATTGAAERILAAAERLFGERGLDGVSTRDIAAAAGVSKANIFHHFSSKLALYEAVLTRGSQRFRALLQQLAADDRELAALLADFSRQHLQGLLQHPGAASLFLRQLLDLGAGADWALTENIVEQSFDLLVDTFTALKAQGRLAEHTDPRVLALTLVGSHLSFFLLRNMPAREGQPGLDADTFGRQLAGLLIGGIAPIEPDSPNPTKSSS